MLSVTINLLFAKLDGFYESLGSCAWLEYWIVDKSTILEPEEHDFFFLTVLSLHRFVWAFSGCDEQGLLFF